ncbi:uncharacterized protein EI90DRAFT_1878102 [Cantharellus anzutake]|uniref:uncharacterized protein n=1 Tax=Cantharellus anzutake TaxID=1750568 RepID=UPI0019071226|nr:uncharacterized protein EI90DRAFT_1878102 [Cantharellus anzutake]KAF8326843.1 hypothetical protein EI90DRAFT_1878102 [Cantharellus anzutake]
MDVDPIQDIVPPRYAIESDDSDGEEMEARATQKSPPSITVNFNGEPSHSLLILIGQAGEQYRRGIITPSSTTGSIVVDKVKVGEIQEISPSLLVVIITHELPALASNLLAKQLIQTLSPCSVELMDTYSLPIHVSSKPISTPTSPLMCLKTSSFQPAPLNLIPLAPPNIIRSFTASVLCILELRSIPGLAILLPSRFLPPRIPTEQVGPQPPPAYALEQFENQNLADANRAFSFGGTLGWDISVAGKASGFSRPQAQGDIGNGGMYL